MSLPDLLAGSDLEHTLAVPAKVCSRSRSHTTPGLLSSRLQVQVLYGLLADPRSRSRWRQECRPSNSSAAVTPDLVRVYAVRQSSRRPPAKTHAF
jgi:hypothetical protein